MLHGDNVAGMMEACAWSDSISERQLPWVNGGVILLEPLLCATPPLSPGEHPSLPGLSCKGVEANGPYRLYSRALSSLAVSVSCLTGCLYFSTTSSSWFPGSIILGGCPCISFSTPWSINQPCASPAGRTAQLENISTEPRSRGRGEDSLTDCPQ